MTYISIIARAKQICHQPAAENSGWWMDAEWLSVLNDIHLRTVLKTEAILTRDKNTKTVINQEYVDMPLLIIKPTIVYLNKKLIRYKDPETLSLKDSDWVNASAGEPTYYYFMDNEIYFNCPCDDTYDMVIFGVKRVTDMSISQTTPFNGYNYLLTYRKILILGLCMEFFSDTGEVEKKLEYKQEFENALNEMKIEIHSGAKEGDSHFEPENKIFISEI